MTSNSVYSKYAAHWFSGTYTLSFLLQDGRTFNVPYQEQKNGILVNRIFDTDCLTEIRKEKIFPRGKEIEELTSLVQKATTSSIESVSQQILQDQFNIAKTLPTERKGDRRAKYAARVFHLLTGVLATPTELLMGVTRLARACAVLVAMGCGKGVTKARLQFTKDTRKIEQIKRQKNQIFSFASWAAKEARIALLQLVPIIGAQLANQYRMSGSLKGFVDAPAFGGLWAKTGLTIPRLVYGFRNHPSFPSPAFCITCHAEKNYLNDRIPSLERAKAHLINSTEKRIFVRIPVVKEDKFIRYHDASMYFPKESKDITNKTVVLYHGNCEHRDNMLGTSCMYLEQGYNVLLAAYAGDTVVQGTGDSYTTPPTKCSEQVMREDARADVEFLKELGVKNVATHGLSLGGAQAMNFAQVVPKELSLDFVCLEKTFTNMADAAGNVIRNSPFNPLAKITSALTRKFILEESEDEGCDGLDNEKKLSELSRNQKFANTKFCILGATEDTIMGNPTFPPDNFATKLKKAVHNQNQVHFELQSGGHNSLPSFSDAMSFLFPSK